MGSGCLGGLLGSCTQQQAAQQNAYNQALLEQQYYTMTSGGTTIGAYKGPTPSLVALEPQPSTNEAWLDRRVNEMRVAL